MRGVNKVILIGNATRDAELRHTQSGKPVSSTRLATNRQIKGEEETQFHTIVCWDRLAETIAEYVKKGDPLYVEGRLQYRSYQDEEGKERGVAEIVAVIAVSNPIPIGTNTAAGSRRRWPTCCGRSPPSRNCRRTRCSASSASTPP
jgi:single stranded DNA-binding protein